MTSSIDRSRFATLKTNIPQIKIAYPSAVILANPIGELISHITHCKCPKVALVRRVVKVCFLFIFRWHFYDRMMIDNGVKDQQREIVYSFHHNDVTCKTEAAFNKIYPFMQQKATYLRIKPTVHKHFPRIYWQVPDTYEDISLKANSYIRRPIFHQEYDTINPDTYCDYMQNFFEAKVTTKEKGNSIYKLLRSPSFTKKSFTEMKKIEKKAAK